jgi:hypothetical protein
VHTKTVQVGAIVGLLLLLLVLPQLALADGPAIFDVSVTDITGTTAQISWNTNTTSDSRVNYGDTIGLGTPVYVGSNSTTHNIILAGLTPGTKYYFEVQSTDASGTATDNNGGAFYSFDTVAPSVYSITLEPVCGVCGDLVEVGICGEVIGVTALVAMDGMYHICWDSLTNVRETFTASGPGVYEVTFFLPEAAKGIHTVYLVDNTYAQKASTTFEVLPFVRMNPEEGPVGTNVTFNGYGFVASQQIRIKFKDVIIGSTAANSVGSWMISYTIPATPGGGYTFTIEASDGTAFYPWLLKYFKVTPKITVTPSSGTVRQTIAVNGSGFAEEEDGIKITFDGKVVKEDIYAGADGSWGAIIAVPAVQNDRYTIDASGTSTRARYVPDVEFTVVPGIWVEPISAYIGDTITVTGGGFALEETGIRIYFDGMDVTPVTITANMSGCWESFFTLPTSTYGSHTVSASGDITQPAVTKTVNTKARILAISPVEGAPGDSVSLHGDGFHGSQQLTMSVGGVAASGDMNSQSNGNVDISFRVPKGSVEGQQMVVVTDESGASDSVAFTVTQKTLSMIPLPISPKDSTLRSGTVTYRWQGTTGGTGYSYILEVSGEGSTWSKSLTASTYTLTEDEALDQKGTYHWRVKIVDDYGNEGPWSESIEFRVSPIPTWVWVVVGLVVLIVLLVVAYRETKFRVTE